MRKRLRNYRLSLLTVLIAVALATGVYLHDATPVSYEEALVEVQIDAAGPQAQSALAQYPDLAPKLFSLYGKESEFQEMLEGLGHNQTFPVVGMCFLQGDALLTAQRNIGVVVDSVLKKEPMQPPQNLDPVECGRMMIHKIVLGRNDFLRRFVLDTDKNAHRLYVTTLTSSLSNFFLGGIRTVERKYAVGESLTPRDLAEATLDVVGVLGATKLAKVALIGRSGKTIAAGRTIASAAGSATALSSVSRFVKPALYVGVAYTALYHPSYITGLGGKLASLLGFQPLLGQALIWAIPTLLGCFALLTVYFWIRPLVWVIEAAVVKLFRLGKVAVR